MQNDYQLLWPRLRFVFVVLQEEGAGISFWMERKKETLVRNRTGY